MKKTLATVMLAGLMLAGCSGQAAVKPTPTASAAVAVAPAAAIAVPAVVDLTLDKATDKLVALGLKAEATDIENSKTIVSKKNWVVVTQDPGEGAGVSKGSTVKLGVRPVVKATPTPTPTPPAPVPFVAPVAPVAPAAPPVPVAPKAPVAPAPVVPKAPPAAPAPPQVGGTIICKDGYVWPGTTRQGACSRHGGIR